MHPGTVEMYSKAPSNKVVFGFVWPEIELGSLKDSSIKPRTGDASVASFRSPRYQCFPSNPGESTASLAREFIVGVLNHFDEDRTMME